MMDRRLVLVPLLALAGAALSGCVAVAIPAIAGAGIAGTRVDGREPGDNKSVPGRPAPQVAAATGPAPVPARSPAVTAPPVSASAPSVTAVAQAPARSPAPAVAPPPPSAPLTAPSAPSSGQAGFAQFVRYGRGVAAVSAQSTGPLSAMLADPVALDGQRQRCEAGVQPVAVIDLDPKGGVFVPPGRPIKDNGLVLGLAVLREAGVQIAWLSDLPVAQIGAVRSALEQSGLDPRGEDIISLSRDPEDRKQARRENLAANSCVIAIAGDEKADFDERFKYLRNPEAGAALEAAIGDGWFLIEPIPVAEPQDEAQQGPRIQ